MKRSVLIAGVGGASLGTEIIKCLVHCGNYNIYGADISPYAFGLYQECLNDSFLVDRERYIWDILDICKKSKIDVIIPGGEEPSRLLSDQRKIIEEEGILLATNSDEVIELGMDKIKTFNHLQSRGIAIPRTLLIDRNTLDDLSEINYPCIIKPAVGTGGSVFVTLAEDKEEAIVYATYLIRRGIVVIAQEYIPLDEGEYTVGVLSLSDGEIVGSIALRRFFNAKLSCLSKFQGKVISSGYSQGLIDDFAEVRRQAEIIAREFGSRGPLNIQGRLYRDIFYPFEINPRFSASVYLRTLAGFNEVDIFLQYLLNNKNIKPGAIKYGYYFRTLDEKYISRERIQSDPLDK